MTGERYWLSLAMKALTALLLVFFASGGPGASLAADTWEWEWENPLPQRNHLNGV